MDMHRDSGFAGRLEVVATGRRRRWNIGEKVRIVEESLAGHRQASATARRHDIPNSLLFKWRKAYRDGSLEGADSAASSFVPAFVVPAEIEALGTPPPVGGSMEIVVSQDRRIIVGADVDAAALGRVLDVLERR